MSINIETVGLSYRLTENSIVFSIRLLQRGYKKLKSPEVHISSMVVHAQPEELESTKKHIAGLTGVEIHGESETGKLVVVLESDTENYISDVIEQINNFEYVLNTALVYHQILPENFEEHDLS